MMDNQNQMFRLRIGTDGRIALSPRILSIPSSVNLASIASVPKRVLEAGIEAPKRVLEAGIEARDQMKVRAKRRWRKAVTGDPEKRIRWDRTWVYLEESRRVMNSFQWPHEGGAPGEDDWQAELHIRCALHRRLRVAESPPRGLVSPVLLGHHDLPPPLAARDLHPGQVPTLLAR